MTLKELRTRIRMEMGNPTKEELPDSEIDFHINEGQRLLCSDGGLLRATATDNGIKDQERYSIATSGNTIQGIVRVDYDDKKLIPIDYNDIEELDVT